MLKNPKSKGSRSERKVRDELRKLGYHVIKAGGSLGMWDLVALPDWATTRDLVSEIGAVVIQVKSNRMPDKKELGNLRGSTVIADKKLAIVHDRKGIEWIDL